MIEVNRIKIKDKQLMEVLDRWEKAERERNSFRKRAQIAEIDVAYFEKEFWQLAQTIYVFDAEDYENVEVESKEIIFSEPDFDEEIED